MKHTRKLQFAAELIEEAADEVEPDRFSDQLSTLADEVDELRGPIHQEHAARTIRTSTNRTQDR